MPEYYLETEETAVQAYISKYCTCQHAPDYNDQTASSNEP